MKYQRSTTTGCKEVRVVGKNSATSKINCVLNNHNIKLPNCRLPFYSFMSLPGAKINVENSTKNLYLWYLEMNLV